MNAQQIVDLLNEAYRLDPSAMHALLSNRVPCTKELAAHPTIEVDDIGTPGHAKVGLLGILNGITRIDGDTIASVWEDVPDNRPVPPGWTKAGKTRENFIGFQVNPREPGKCPQCVLLGDLCKAHRESMAKDDQEPPRPMCAPEVQAKPSLDVHK